MPLVPELGITTEAGETSQQVPGTYLNSSRHRALPPERHDLDPYVPIGMRLAASCCSTEAEIELSSKTGVFVEGSINDRDYKQPISSAGLRRGSSGYVLLSGRRSR